MKIERFIEKSIEYSIERAASIQPVFDDRTHGGQAIAELIEEKGYSDPVIFAIPTGGVPVALPIKRKLDVPLLFAASSKIPISKDTRFGAGAMASEVVVWDRDLLDIFGLSETDQTLQSGIRYAASRIEQARRELVYGDTPRLENKTAILVVDDGIATGYTTLAAALSLKYLSPRSIVIASPVASETGCKLLTSHGFEYIVSYISSASPLLIDNLYRSFPQLSFSDVRSMIEGDGLANRIDL